MNQREELLHEFCRSLDAMDRESFKSFKQIVLDILKSDFKTVSSDIKLDGCRSNGAPALDTMWLDNKDRNSRDPVPVKNPDGKYSSQRAFVYDVGCPLWIDTKSGDPIDNPRNRSDVLIRPWGDFPGEFEQVVDDIPEYQNYSSKGKACTSVIVPLRYGSDRPRIFGVLCLEFEDQIECTEYTTRRIGTLARAVAKAIWLYETTQEARRGTGVALSTLEKRMAAMSNVPGLYMPTVFFAFSSRADETVKQTIIDVVERYSDHIRLDNWEKHEQPGRITSHISKCITTASYGICYFSEPAQPRSKVSYVDNPNVLIEAGMMNAVFHQQNSASSRWLLVREDHGDELTTGDPAFDFRDQRHLLVPRKPRRRGQRTQPTVDIEALSAKLESALGNMFGRPQSDP